MGPTHFILLLSLSVFLAVWGLAQVGVWYLERDRQKLQQRLQGQQASRIEELTRRAVRAEKPLEDMPPFLAHSRLLQRLNRNLHYAYPEARLTRFLGIAGLIGLALFGAVTVVLDSLLMGTLAGTAGVYLPVVFVNSLRRRRQRQLEQQLPDALDFLSRILRAGHSLSTGIQMMGDELPQPIGGEFRRCYDQHSLGRPLEIALRDMASSVDLTDFAFFVTAVLIQRQTGGDLSQVLANIGLMIRNRINLQQHVRAITAEGRLTGYILFGFPMVLFVISYALNPKYTGILLATEVGRIMMGAAVLLQCVGLIFIRRIVNVKV